MPGTQEFRMAGEPEPGTGSRPWHSVQGPPREQIQRTSAWDGPRYPHSPKPTGLGDRGPTAGPWQPRLGLWPGDPLGPHSTTSSACHPRPRSPRGGMCYHFLQLPWMFELTFTSSRQARTSLRVTTSPGAITAHHMNRFLANHLGPHTSAGCRHLPGALTRK